MKVSYSWLKNYLNIDLPFEDVSDLLTDIGLEVEKIEKFESIKGGLKEVVIGEVLSKFQHPNADRLNITSVDIGDKEPIQIVCGAPNISTGQLVPVAKIGAKLFIDDDILKIKKGKIRGEYSYGMICSQRELGLGKDDLGIMVLDKDAKVGDNASKYFKLETDIVFEIGLTPNRSDAMGHIGVARDLMTVLNHQGGDFQLCRPSVNGFKTENKYKNFIVEVNAPKLCPRYSGICISNIKVADSPNWLQIKLKSIGIIPTNNVVDITNYVLHELGQPLHAYDLSKIEGEKIIVSTINNLPKLVTLDKVEREISNSDLVISDCKKPLCIAGVMGSLSSAVDEKTSKIFLESAYFNSVSIRNTSKKHNISSDASFRFERGCDVDITLYALKRAALLITEICGGENSSKIIDIYNKPINKYCVNLTYKKMDELIGEKIDRDSVRRILNDLEIEITKSTDDGLNLEIPYFRSDVQREVDVIEEILRIYGYNTVKIPYKLNSSIIKSDDDNEAKITNIVADVLANRGFNEVMNNSLTKKSYTNLISELSKDEEIEIINPLSLDLCVLRQSLLFNGLENILYNQNRKYIDVKIFEFGKTYHKKSDNNLENQHLQILVCGRANSENWDNQNKTTDFFFIKKIVEHIINRLGVKKIKFERISGNGYSEGVNLLIDDKKLVSFGKIDQKICKVFNIKTSVYGADFNWDLLLALAHIKDIKYKKISKFPSVRRDLSLMLDNSVSFDQLKKIAFETNNNVLKEINLFDVYEGDKLPKGKKSYAISFVMNDISKTLTDDYVDNIMKRLIKNFTEKVGAELR